MYRTIHLPIITSTNHQTSRSDVVLNHIQNLQSRGVSTLIHATHWVITFWKIHHSTLLLSGNLISRMSIELMLVDTNVMLIRHLNKQILQLYLLFIVSKNIYNIVNSPPKTILSSAVVLFKELSVNYLSWCKLLQKQSVRDFLLFTVVTFWLFSVTLVILHCPIFANSRDLKTFELLKPLIFE